MVAPATLLHPDDKLCGPAFVGNYTGKIVIVPDMVYLLETIEKNGKKIDFSTAHCSLEAKYEKIANSGALGAVTMAVDKVPSMGEYLRGGTTHDPELYNQTILLSAYIEHLYPIIQMLSQNVPVQLAMTCDEPNLAIPYLKGMSAAIIGSGLARILLGLYAIFSVIQSLAIFQRMPFSRQQDPTTKHNAVSRRRIHGQGPVLCIYAFVNLLVGFAHTFGLMRLSRAPIQGDEHAPWNVKLFFSTGLMGLQFFLVCVVAVFWFEMSESVSKLRPLRNIFTQKRYLLFLLGAFVIIVSPDLMIASRYAQYYPENQGRLAMVYPMLTTIAAVIFLVSVRRLLNHINLHLTRTGGHHGRTDATGIAIQRFAIHMGFWLRFFALFCFLQSFYLILFMGAKIRNRGPAQTMAMQICIWPNQVLLSFVLLIGLRGPQQNKELSKNHNVDYEVKPAFKADLINTLEDGMRGESESTLTSKPGCDVIVDSLKTTSSIVRPESSFRTEVSTA